MTNMWIGVPAEKLCDQHLLGLHRELHQEAGTLANHPHGESIVHGHWIRGQVDLTELKRRHEEVVEEMKSRGFNHDSPLDLPDTDKLLPGNPILEKINRAALDVRCDDCQI